MFMNTKTKTTMYNAAFTPAEINRTTDVLGRKMVRARGIIRNKNGKTFERTVMVQGKNASTISQLMRKGREIILRGIYETAPAQGDAKRGGTFFTALCLPNKAAT